MAGQPARLSLLLAPRVITGAPNEDMGSSLSGPAYQKEERKKKKVDPVRLDASNINRVHPDINGRHRKRRRNPGRPSLMMNRCVITSSKKRKRCLDWSRRHRYVAIHHAVPFFSSLSIHFIGYPYRTTQFFYTIFKGGKKGLGR